MTEMTKENIAWVDILRITACFLVIISHSCDFFVSKFDADYTEFLCGVSWGSLVRSCVPLFVMISGVLLLPVKTDTATFYSRRMKRIVIPLVFWSVVLPILFYLYLSMVNTTNPSISMDEHTPIATLKKIATFIFNFNYDTIPLWYLYMIIGVYLFIPIVGAWLVKASQRDIKRFIMIWGISLFLPYIQLLAPLFGYAGNYGDMGLLGVCTWNAYGSFYYFSGFLGYIVLAHYLMRFPLNWHWGRTFAVAIPLFLVGYLITLFGYVLMQKYYPANYTYLEIIWYFSGINVFLMTFAVFIIVSKLKIGSSPWLSKIASLTFGIYLCHFVIVQAGYDLIYTHLHVPPYLQIPVIAIFTFAISLCITWLMSKSSLLRRVIG